MTRFLTPSLLLILLSPSLLFISCSREEKVPPHSLVTMYAELLLLHEKEKLVNRIPDSVYVQKVQEFFAAHSMREEEFTSRVNEISTDVRRWKEFLQDVTTTMDSITAAERTSGH